MFSKIPFGLHNMSHLFYAVVIHVSIVFGLRVCVGISVIPFESLCAVVINLAIVKPLLQGTRCIRAMNPRTQSRELLSLSHYFFVPKKLRFSDKAWNDLSRVQMIVLTSYAFGFLYVRRISFI